MEGGSGSESACGRKSGHSFGDLAPEERKRIAARGGSAVKPENRSFSKDPALAARAGSKGGKHIRSQLEKSRARARAGAAKAHANVKRG